MGTLIAAVGRALVTAFDMFWDVLWPLVLGFTITHMDGDIEDDSREV